MRENVSWAHRICILYGFYPNNMINLLSFAGYP